MTELGQKALEAIVEDDPQRAALRTLELVRKHLGATSVGLFTIRPSLLLYTATAMDQAGLDRVARAWEDRSVELLKGEVVVATAHVIAPIGRPAAALLYAAFAGPRREQVSELCAAVSPLLELAIASRSNSEGTYIERAPLGELQKHQLLTLLDRVAGNVSEAARRLGVTRVTIYARLRRYGIEHHRPNRKK